MSAIKQYIDLYRECREELERGSHAPLNVMRPLALGELEAAEAEGQSFPSAPSEDYVLVSPEKILSGNFGMNTRHIEIGMPEAGKLPCSEQAMSPLLYLLVNDCCRPALQSDSHLPEGVVCGSLAEVAAKYPRIIEKYYGNQASGVSSLTALNTLFATDGLVLYVPDGVVMSKPVQCIAYNGLTVPFLSNRRLLVILGENAEASLLLCDHTAAGSAEVVVNEVAEIYVGKGSHFQFYDMEETSSNNRRLATVLVSQEADSSVLYNGITLSNGVTRNDYRCTFAGEGSSLKLMGMGIEDGDSVLETFSDVRHDVARCHTDELFKYAVDDNALGSFAGRIYVAHGAEKTEAYQANRNIVGSDTARMYSKPQLEIYNDDVKCSHGTAIGALDPMQLFYMRTRGLDESTAKLLLKQAFMSDVVDAVRIPSLQQRLRFLVERRFAGEKTACSECRGHCEIENI